jgi:hypothetical protein
MWKKTPKQLDIAPRLSSDLIGKRMKNKSSTQLYCLLLPSLWACHTVALAQQGNYGNALTNNYQSPTNYFQSPLLGSTTPGSGMLGAAFMGTSALAGSPAAGASFAPTGPPLVTWGPVAVYPHLLYALTYGNGIEAQPGVNSTTLVNTVSPGVLLEMGAHWILDYSAGLAFYSNPVFKDTTSQRVILTGGTTYGNWALNFSQSYVNSTEPLVETGTQLGIEAFATVLDAIYQMNDKMSLQLGLNQNFRSAEELNDLHEWITADWLNYQFQPQLSAALGVTGGYDEVSLGSDMPFEEALGRVFFLPGSKLRLMLVGGLEERQFIHPGAPSFFGPVFSASALYQVLEGTSVTISANRTVLPSFYGDEINVTTGVAAVVQQQIVGKTHFAITAGYTSEPFTSIVPGPVPPGFENLPIHNDLTLVRTDSRYYASFRLSTLFSPRLTGSIFYLITDNISSQANFSYSGNQVGLDLSYRY